MKSIVLLLGFIAALPACMPTTDPVVGGALTGAVLGAAVSDDGDRVEGALIGAGVGGIAGSLIGQSSRPGYCVYRDVNGNRYTARC